LALAVTLWRWSGERNAVADQLSAAVSTLQRIESLFTREFREEELRWKGLRDNLNEAREERGRLLATLEAGSRPQLPAAAGAAATGEQLPVSEGPGSLESSVESGSEPLDLEKFPDIPGGRNPQVVLELDIDGFLADPELNPKQKTLTRLEASQARLELARARARTAVLDAEIRLGLVQAMDRLREKAAYVDYADGECYENPERVLTVGEENPGGGVRMYYLSEDEFPDLYARRREKAAVAERATRELLAKLQE
jgi:hypothetical protein